MVLTVRRTRKEVRMIEVELLKAPIARCVLIPAGQIGAMRINGTHYGLSYVMGENSNGDVLGYEVRKQDGSSYCVPYDLLTCECLDWLTRDRPLGCKHIQALRQLREEGRIG